MVSRGQRLLSAAGQRSYLSCRYPVYGMEGHRCITGNLKDVSGVAIGALVASKGGSSKEGALQQTLSGGAPPVFDLPGGRVDLNPMVDLITAEITHCHETLDAQVRDAICSNILVCGGCASIPGLVEELAHRLEFARRVRAFDDPAFAPLRGGSFFTGLPEFRAAALSIEEWQEHGAARVHQKCVL